MKPNRCVLRALLALTVTLGLSVPLAASANGAFGAQWNVNLVEDVSSVGVHGRWAFVQWAHGVRAELYPNVDLFVFSDDLLMISVDIDLVIPVDLDSFLEPYAGIGVGITYMDFDPGEDTQTDLNLLGGITVITGTPVEVYGEAQFAVGGTDHIEVGAGVSVRFGRTEPYEPEEPDVDDDLDP